MPSAARRETETRARLPIATDAAGEQTVGVTDEHGMEIKRVKTGHVQMVMALRYEEIFKIIADELAKAGLTGLLRAGRPPEAVGRRREETLTEH